MPAGATMEVKVPLAALAKRRTWPGADGGDDGGARRPVGRRRHRARRARAADARRRRRASARSTTRNVRFVESFAGDVFLGAAAGLAMTAAVIVHRLSAGHLRRHARGATVGEEARRGAALWPGRASRCAGERSIPARALGFGAIALAFVVGVAASHGCIDDRKKVAAQVFFCNPSSRTADADCGTGFMCYSAAQALGGSICVPTCDPNDRDHLQAAPARSRARASRAARCRSGDRRRDPCPAPLVCGRITDSPIEAAERPRRRLPAAQRRSARSNADCTSPVFTECTGERQRRDAGHRACSTSGERRACRASATPQHRLRAGLGVRARRLADDDPGA